MIPGLIQVGSLWTAHHLLLYRLAVHRARNSVTLLVVDCILKPFIITILNLIIKSAWLLIEHLLRLVLRGPLLLKIILLLPLSVLLYVSCSYKLGRLVL